MTPIAHNRARSGVTPAICGTASIENQMQINNGANDKFAAWADSGGLRMGTIPDPNNLPLWHCAQRYVLADHFFMGAFGGSFLNHQYLICSCAPIYPHANTSRRRKALRSPSSILMASASRSSADRAGLGRERAAKIRATTRAITPDFYAVNTMQPPYQPSAVAPAAGQRPRLRATRIRRACCRRRPSRRSATF